MAFALAAIGCRSEVWVEGPDERREARARADTAAAPVMADTVYRPAPIDSVAASFAWVVERPRPLVTAARSFPEGPVEAARQFVRALAQTGSTAEGTVGVGEVGYERAFTYLHPRVRGRRSWESWAPALAGIVRPAFVRLEPVPGDSSRVFVELLILREIAGQSLLGLYYGHFAAAPGDNGWQLTAARLESVDWAGPLGAGEAWRYDRAGAARAYAAEDSSYAIDLVELKSGEWVPLARPAANADLTLGLPELR
ncbi:MAG TPA: hypothetical protein VM737_08215 [Gemmatimonadota bacterium]|nr:hypothetical protein [Gemmatimonadota bacterium]